MELNKILDRNKKVRYEKEWEGEAVWFEALEKALTPGVLQSFADIAKQPIELANGLSAILTDWNVFREKEGDFPPTADNLKDMPIEFLNFILETIAESWSGNAPAPEK